MGERGNKAPVDGGAGEYKFSEKVLVLIYGNATTQSQKVKGNFEKKEKRQLDPRMERE